MDRQEAAQLACDIFNPLLQPEGGVSVHALLQAVADTIFDVARKRDDELNDMDAHLQERDERIEELEGQLETMQKAINDFILASHPCI